MMIDNSVLTLRHVKKEKHYSHLYVDGDTGGIHSCKACTT
ncbi:hypothetical protein JOE49_000751 [Paenibacillus sp. PvR133]|nr:hypothetical protein [Paenibacillus sp. PvR133]